VPRAVSGPFLTQPLAVSIDALLSREWPIGAFCVVGLLSCNSASLTQGATRSECRTSRACREKLSWQQEISGESFAMDARLLLDKWEARGLNPTVLAAIRTEVFNIGEPKP